MTSTDDPTPPPFLLSARQADAHKGDFGRVGIVAGSREMTGAAILCGRAALRSGAGLVHLYVPKSAHPIVALGHPCYMVHPLDEDNRGRLAPQAVDDLANQLESMDVVAMGPGCGTGPGLAKLIPLLLGRKGKLVLDADGLNQMAQDRLGTRTKWAELILTPHPGEMARLLASLDCKPGESRLETAQTVARLASAVVLLKGHQTVIGDGNRAYLNSTGNPGMATGGSGDVLTGIISALWCQGLGGFEAACLGAWVHGRAGDLMARTLGQISLVATDLIDGLPGAFAQVVE